MKVLHRVTFTPGRFGCQREQIRAEDHPARIPLRRWEKTIVGHDETAVFVTPDEIEAAVAEKTVMFVLEHHRPTPNSYPDCMM